MEEEDYSEKEVQLVEEAYVYMTTKKYPNECTENRKRTIRKKSLKFHIEDGELYYKQKQKGKGEVLLRYLQSKEEQVKVLHACHVDPTSGHLGKTRTIYWIKERFMWHGMVKDVVNMISKCDVCQRMNRKMTTGAPQLHPISVQAPWHMIGIDFVGPLSPVADDGSRYILTISDYFTKWVEAIPTPDKSAPQVASVLFKICRLPDEGRKMVQCTSCTRWYHCDCMKISTKRMKSIENSNRPWYCGNPCHC